MKADFNTIRAITVGAVRVWETADGVRFSRFTEEENAKICAYSKFVKKMAQTLTGVRLDFYTDARAISFMLAKGNVVDVWLNGVFRQTVRCESLRDKGESAARIPLVDPLGAPYEKTRVTIWFPINQNATLAFLDAEGASYIRPIEYKRHLLFLGDSISAGWKCRVESTSFTSRLTRFFDADSLNCSLSCGFFSPALIGPNGYRPDAITITLGTNDFTHWDSFGAFYENCTAYLDKVRALYPNVPTVVITPIIRLDNARRPIGTFAEVRKTIADEAKKRGVFVVDGFSLFPADESFFAGDGVHPNDLGFNEFSLALIPQLQKILRW